MSMPKTTRREWLAAGVVLVVLAAVGFSYVHGRLLYYSDSRTYIEGAESLLAGQGYCVGGKPAVTWPPGYAAILSIPMAMGLGKVAVYKVINLLLALGALAFWWRAFRRMSDKGTALLAAAVGGLFFPWIYYSQTILAELLLAFFVGGAFLAATRYADDERTGDLVWLTLFAMLTPLVKMAGLAFLAGWGYVVFIDRFRAVRLLRERQWRALGISLLAGCVVVAPLTIWCLRNWRLTGSPTGYELGMTAEYLSSVEKIGITHPTLFSRLWVSIRGYTHILIVPDQSGIARVGKLPLVVNLACVALSLSVLVGWGRALACRSRRAGAGMFALYGGLLILNSWYDIRYLLPVMPIYFFYLADGIGLLAGAPMRWLFGRVAVLQPLTRDCVVRWCVLGGLTLAFLAFNVAAPQAKRLRKPTYGPTIQRLYEASAFIKDSDVQGRILTAGGGGFVPLWSGRETVSLLGRLDVDNALESLDIPEDVAFLLLDESKFAPYRERYMEPVVEANSDRLKEVFREGNTIVYEVTGSAM